ncbi:putative oxidoreductase ucpA [Xylogone sp. PMI_703]|nr:putative oxidoreductase ucpA [Xylogone sp. PMI_703]
MDLYALYHFTKEMHHDVYPSISPSNPDLSVKGQTVLISEGGTGIGLATAKFYAQAGAKTIIIVSRNVSRLSNAVSEILKSNSNTAVHAFGVDVGSKDSVDALWAQFDGKFEIDVLINNSGISDESHFVGTGSPSKWWEIQQTNVFGTYLMSYNYIATRNKARIPGNGTIINISSQLTFATMPGGSSYSLSKLAVAKLAKFIHSEHPNIRSFAVHPGIIPTDMGSSLGDAAKDTVELAAGLNLYLASPRADYLRGKYTTANWDVDELEAHRSEITGSNILNVSLDADYGPEGHVW